MSLKTEIGGTCSICYTSLENTEHFIIEENILELCTFLIPRLDTFVLQGSPLCEVCLTKIQEAYNFKALRFESLSLDAHRIDESEFDITPRTVLCLICRNVVNKYFSAPLLPLIEENDIKETILYLITDKELKCLQNPQACADCQNILLTLCDILTLLSIYDVRSQGFSVNYAENKYKIPDCEDANTLSIKNDFAALSMNNYDGAASSKDIKTETIEPVPSTSKAVPEAAASSSSFTSYPYKNGEVKKEKDDGKTAKSYEEEEWNMLETYRVFKHQNANIFVCIICRFSTGHQLYINNHSLMHKVSEDVNFDGRCPCCVYRATRKLCLIRHMMGHHQGFSDNNKRKRPNSTDTNDDGTFCSCRTCVYEMKMNPQDLFTDENSKVLTYKCFQCPYQTKWSYFLARHMKTHKNECPECEYSTKCKADLKKHIQLHKRELLFPPFPPFTTPKSKWETPAKKQKITLHEGTVVKMYSCGVCDFQTIVKPTLKKHMLTHKNVKFP